MPLRILNVGVGPSPIEKIPRPGRQLAVGIAILRRDELHEVGKLLVVVRERIEIGRDRPRSARTPRAGLCSTVAVAGERQASRRARRRSRSRRCCRTRRGSSAATSAPARSRGARQHAQIMAVARAQHDAVLAERHRVGVAIFGLVMDRQERHRRSNHRDFVQSNLYRSLLISRSVCRFDRQQVKEHGFGQRRRHIITPRRARMFRRCSNIMRPAARRSC